MARGATWSCSPAIGWYSVVIFVSTLEASMNAYAHVRIAEGSQYGRDI
jgi:hypothetical protein